MNKIRQKMAPRKDQRLIVAISLALGVLTFIAVRFVMLESKAVHYHANFALYVNGQREEFNSFAYYEEVSTCGSAFNPKAIVHMHDKINHVVHVHRAEATWTQFFANLGWTLGDNALVSPDGKTYVNGENGARLKFYLNGREAGAVSNQVIADESALVISYGSEDEQQLKAYFDDLKKDAYEFNLRNDPSACTGAQAESLGSRLKRAAWD